MLYYLAEGIIKDIDRFETDEDSRTYREIRRKIKENGNRFNERLEGDSFVFVQRIHEEEMRVGIIVSDRKDAEALLIGFLDAIEIGVENIKTTEVTFNRMERFLNAAEREDFIEDADDVLTDLDLDGISRFRHNGNINEIILPEGISKEKMYKIAEDHLTEGSLVPELDRIFAGRQEQGGTGHPVHYMIRTDDPQTQDILSKTLAQALYINGRLDSRRFCLIEIRPGERFSMKQFELIYKNIGGGCVAIRFTPVDESEDTNMATGELEVIRYFSDLAKSFRNQVLTMFLLPREAERTRNRFHDNLGSLTFIEIREELADKEQAITFLTRKATEDGVEVDKDLLNKLEEGQEFMPYDLNRMFEEWMSHRMKALVYPQYLNVVSSYEKKERNNVRGSAIEELREMVGLDEAKSVIQKAVKYYKMQQIFRDRGLPQDRPAMHMVFMGNPGTAKTTAARLFARIMKENGLLSRGHLVEVGRSDLVAKYVGWTAKTVKEKFELAKGGVLFIDEAYSLVDDKKGMFGDEAINTIVQEMENRREDLVVILAGYPKEMQQFLDRNPGLRSRIAFHVPFMDYNAEELCGIASLLGRSKGVELTEDAMDKLRIGFEAACQIPSFGNGRYVRNVLELSKMNQAERVLEMDPDKISDKELRTLEAEDIQFPKLEFRAERKSIGFAG